MINAHVASVQALLLKGLLSTVNYEQAIDMLAFFTPLVCKVDPLLSNADKGMYEYVVDGVSYPGWRRPTMEQQPKDGNLIPAGLLLNTMALLPLLLAEFAAPSDLALAIAMGIARVCGCVDVWMCECGCLALPRRIEEEMAMVNVGLT
jgi:hypothetical protein